MSQAHYEAERLEQTQQRQRRIQHNCHLTSRSSCAWHVKLAMLRRRGAANMGSTLHRSSNSRQALDACALALLSTSRNFVKALHGASDYPTTSVATWSHLAERPFTSSRPKSAAPCSPSPSLQAFGSSPSPFGCLIHLRRPPLAPAI